jgi:hypothetical protein
VGPAVAERAGEDQEREKSDPTLVFARNPPEYLLQKVLLKNA